MSYITLIARPCFLSACFSISLLISPTSSAAEAGFVTAKARASEITPNAQEYANIDFVFGTKEKPTDLQHASYSPNTKSRGQLMIWLMSYNGELFKVANKHGIHAIQVHYANKWFAKVCREQPTSEHSRGNMRLEATTGEDHHHEADIQTQDGMMERARHFLIHLHQEDKKGKWSQFLSKDQSQVLWDKVIIAGASHGASSAARFAKAQKVHRVVMLCGPRDQYQSWQGLPSATPANAYFGFSHAMDKGWELDHYCRSWEMLGLHQYGAIVLTERSKPPYSNSRRLVSTHPMPDANIAHSGIQPGSKSPKDQDGNYLYQPIWDYLLTHPIEEIGEPVDQDDDCLKDQR